MNREEQIVEAGKLAASDNKFSDLAMKQHRVMSAYEMGFIDGAVWADKNYNWISVEDELPPKRSDDSEYSAVVLSCDSNGFMETAVYDHVRKKWCYAGDVVTHWISLPAPPRKEN